MSSTRSATIHCRTHFFLGGTCFAPKPISQEHLSTPSVSFLGGRVGWVFPLPTSAPNEGFTGPAPPSSVPRAARRRPRERRSRSSARRATAGARIVVDALQRRGLAVSNAGASRHTRTLHVCRSGFGVVDWGSIWAYMAVPWSVWDRWPNIGIHRFQLC